MVTTLLLSLARARAATHSGLSIGLSVDEPALVVFDGGATLAAPVAHPAANVHMPIISDFLMIDT
jgi:hypothetical protein